MTDTLFSIARSGLEVERQRVAVIASNIANAGTPLRPDGTGFAPMTLVTTARSESTFSNLIDQGIPPALGVQVQGFATLNTPPRLLHDPAHPYANADGYVAYPDIDQAIQMSLLVQTQRAYEANIVMFNAARSMYAKALDLGGRK